MALLLCHSATRKLYSHAKLNIKKMFSTILNYLNFDNVTQKDHVLRNNVNFCTG